MLVGFVVEGWDHLILRAYLAKLLNRPENDLDVDPVGGPGSGWHFVMEITPIALKRFYGKCADFAIIALDNDGNEDLQAKGLTEDPMHPRHWLHADQPIGAVPRCRWCSLETLVAATRPRLTWLTRKPGATWPVIVGVPVEALEAWLLISRAIVNPGHGSSNAEMELRHQYKLRFYGRPAAARRDVEEIAVPLVRSMEADDLVVLRQHSMSFRQFADQVARHRRSILGSTTCW